MLFKNVTIDGLNIFYREAGNEGARSLSCCTDSRHRRINIAI